MDKTARAILRWLTKNSAEKGTQYICAFDEGWKDSTDAWLNDMAKSLNLRVEDARAAVRFLADIGMLEYQNSGDYHLGFHLSHRGLHWRYYRRQEILNYIADKWPDFIAVVISLLSLIISVIALGRPQPG